ncbi:hypothetical protein [uncultured Gammaproteobacteria bacterium]|nr:hypothetical protein [uncultured Gammaproteobacteria bacterium]
MYATGLYSCKKISDILYKEGFRTGNTSKEGIKVGRSKIHVILNEPFYYGMMSYHGKLYIGKYEAIIEKKLFDDCQRVKNGNTRPMNKKHSFLLRGLCSCAKCGCSITAEKQKGYSYYHCTNGKGICDQKKNFIREHQLSQQVSESVFKESDFNEK